MSTPILRRQLFALQPDFSGGHLLIYLLNHGYATEIIEWHQQNPTIPIHCFYDKPGAPYLPLVCAAGILASRSFVVSVSSVCVGLVSGLVRGLVFVAALPLAVVVALARAKKRPVDADAGTVPSPLARTVPIQGPLDGLPLPEAIDDWSIEAYRRPSWHQRMSELAFPLLHVVFAVAVIVALRAR